MQKEDRSDLPKSQVLPAMCQMTEWVIGIILYFNSTYLFMQ